MFTFLLIVQTLVAVAMISVILMQRSEGGGLVSGGGGGSSLMSARGAADFLTRSTAILATVFVLLSIALAAIAAGERTPRSIDPSLVDRPPAGSPIEQQPSPFTGVPVPGAQTQPTPGQPVQEAPAEESGVPLAQ